MAEDTQTTTTQDGGGPEGKQPGDGGQAADKQTTATDKKESKTFTQDELDAILAERLSREQKKVADKYGDYDDLKKAAAEWQKHQDAQKSELEKLQEAKSQAEQERDEALQRTQDMIVKTAFMAEAAKHEVLHPEDAYRLADLSDVSINDDGQVEGVDKLVKSLVEAGRLPIKGKQAAPDINAGSGGKQKGRELTDDEKREFAAVYGLNPRYLSD